MTEDAAFEFFETAWEAMVSGDLAKLEDLTYLSPFPRARDGWLGRHWLTHAIGSGNPASVGWVLSKGPVVDYVDDEGFTALQSALQTEADWSHRQNPAIPNAEAAAASTIQMIDMLSAAGVDINQRMNLDDTALHTSAAWSSPAVLRHMLACGADPHARNRDYNSDLPVDHARYAKRPDNIAILREAMEQTFDGMPKAPDPHQS